MSTLRKMCLCKFLLNEKVVQIHTHDVSLLLLRSYVP